MPHQPLFFSDAKRWLMASLVLAVSAGVAGTHAFQAGDQGRGDAAALVGDEKTFAGRLFDGRSGLAIRLDAAQRSVLVRLIGEEPLNGSAVALLALDRQARSDPADAVSLGDQAIKIEPRTRLAWLARLDRQMKLGDTVAAANSAIRLLTFDYQRMAVYLPIIVTLARDPRTIPVISSELAKDPSWRSPLVGLLMQGKVDPAIRYALMNPGKSGTSADLEGDRGFFVEDLVGRGDFERAYLAWLSFLPDSALTRAGLPYDGGFDGLPGPAPFNWKLNSADGDRAAIDGGTLQLSYSGRKAVTLAQQIVLLDPGVYRLNSIVASLGGQGSAGGTTLTWNVHCLPGNTALAALAIDPKTVGKSQLSAPFVVPAAGCPAISLQMDGTASEFPSRLALDIASVELKRSAVVMPSLQPSAVSRP